MWWGSFRKFKIKILPILPTKISHGPKVQFSSPWIGRPMCLPSASVKLSIVNTTCANMSTWHKEELVSALDHGTIRMSVSLKFERQWSSLDRCVVLIHPALWLIADRGRNCDAVVRGMRGDTIVHIFQLVVKVSRDTGRRVAVGNKKKYIYI